MRNRLLPTRAAWIVVWVVALGVPTLAAPDSGADRAPAGNVVLETADRIEIHATFHPAGEPGGPGAVLLPMFKSDRAAWASVIKPLQERGVSVLAIDPRGHGRSAKQGRRDLGKRVAKRDTAVFKAMHKDAIAAVHWLVKEGACDPKRIVLVGASVGFSVAIDTAKRHPTEIAALVGLSPVAKTLGLDTLAMLKKVPAETPLLLLVHQEEVGQGAKQIVELRPGLQVVVYDQARPDEAGQDRGWAHGTRMLDRLPLVDLTIASFTAAATGSESETVLLDGVVLDEGEHADPWGEAIDVGLPGAEGSIRAYRVGRRIVFGGRAPSEAGGLRFEVQTGAGGEGAETELVLGPAQVVAIDLGDGSVAWTWGGMASMPSFPGMGGTPLFGKTVPRMRVVRSADGTTFEGEWFIPEFGDDSSAIRLLAEFSAAPPPRPQGGMVTASPQHAVSLPSR